MEKTYDDTVKETFHEQLLEKLTENPVGKRVRLAIYALGSLLILTILFAFFK